MKNDFDSLLDSMFATGKTNGNGKSRAAQEAEAFLQSINKSSDKINNELQRQLDEMEKANIKAQEQLSEIAKELKSDGLAEEEIKEATTSNEEVKEMDLNSAFLICMEASKKEIIGQDDFLKKLYLSFKRPFVMGLEEDKPASSIIITGKVGTGKHSALSSVVSELSKVKVLNNAEVVKIDLSMYSSNSDSKLLIQDLFAAIHSKASVILFENYEKCHKSLLSMISELVLTGKIQLTTRYILQKGILVEAGTALVPNAISSVTCRGQYLVFITTNNQGKIADAMGAGFMNSISDICMTNDFIHESLIKIGEKEWDNLSNRCVKQLSFTLDEVANIGEFFADKFTINNGINSISEYSSLVYKTLSEYKLNNDVERATLKTIIDDKVLFFTLVNDKIIIEEKTSAGSETALQEVKAQLEDIIGLSSVKEYIFTLEEHYKVQQLRKLKGLKIEAQSMHMIFTGNPGTGKTTIARLVSRYLKAIGVLSGGQLIEVTRADLVGRFVGHTAPLTNQVIESALGGVLFIDEAYSLFRGKDDSFGLEAIDTLVKGMEDNRDNLLVILAGYSKEMDSFLKSNSGLASRFPNIIEFPDYTGEELLDIAEITTRGKGYILDSDCKDPLLTFFEKKQLENARMNGNGRMARNLIESAILNQSKRIIAEGTEDLELLLSKDFDLE